MHLGLVAEDRKDRSDINFFKVGTREWTSLVTRVEQPPSHVGRKKGGEEIQTESTILLSCWDSSRGWGVTVLIV